ncbi:MAG TPA: thioredoxin-like domain-containing protein [Chthoniobacteraceae bacterium]|jgi:nucleoredoxin
MKKVCAASGLFALALLAQPVAAAENILSTALKDKLVAMEGKELKKFDDAPLAEAKYFAFYYSASWCPPCRAFTPDLVKFYKRRKRTNPNFELVFVSNDRSAEDNGCLHERV